MGGGLNTYDYGFRIFNPSLGKFLSVDPLTKDYPWYTPYQFSGNMPIKFIDVDGLEPGVNGEYDGEIRVAPVLNNEDVEGELFYWVWIESPLQAPLSEAEHEWTNISVRPLEVTDFDGEDPYVPSVLIDSGARQAYVDAHTTSDCVDDPTIASTGLASGVEGGRFVCTRYGNSPQCPPGRKYHDGTDIFANPGTPVKSMYTGKVVAIQASYAPGSIGDNGYGNFIEVETEIEEGQTIRIKYAHLDGVGVKVGDYVSSGEVIGTAGATGNASNVQNKDVHVRIRLNGESVDPEPYMPTQFNDEGQANED
jgi:biotin carboxyl carrier protein